MPQALRGLTTAFPFALACSVLLSFSELLNAQTEPTSLARPNIIFFLVDDLGWSDLGCMGSTFYETPAIDALAASGLRLTSAYAACPVCSPTRGSILTGRHPVRLDITDWIPGRRMGPRTNPRFLHIDDRNNLALEEVTLAEVLRDAGYETFFAGKWHLGEEGHWPTDQGFDINIGGNAKGSPPGGYYAPWNNPTLTAQAPDEYLTERLTDESIQFLERQREASPFLLYLSYYNVHTPITPYRERIESFRRKAAEMNEPSPPIKERDGLSRSRQDNAAYASMIAAVDQSVGRILRRLDELQLRDKTIVCFFSDNGGLCTTPRPGPTCNFPLRSGKGWLYEGGIRVPMLLRIPGTTTPGTVSHMPVISTDFFPTLLAAVGLPARPDLAPDGWNLLPLITGTQENRERTLFWHYPHYHGSTWKPGAAIRQGDWKLIEFYEEDTVELYHLGRDLGEREDLGAAEPARVASMRQRLRDWQASMGAKLPQPNPDYRSPSAM